MVGNLNSGLSRVQRVDLVSTQRKPFGWTRLSQGRVPEGRVIPSPSVWQAKFGKLQSGRWTETSSGVEIKLQAG